MAKSKDNSTATSEPDPTTTHAAPVVVSSNVLYGWVWFGAAVYVIGILVKLAYRIRMGAIDEFGPVIHEFDPYFNFRATEVSWSRAEAGMNTGIVFAIPGAVSMDDRMVASSGITETHPSVLALR